MHGVLREVEGVVGVRIVARGTIDISVPTVLVAVIAASCDIIKVKHLFVYENKGESLAFRQDLKINRKLLNLQHEVNRFWGSVLHC